MRSTIPIAAGLFLLTLAGCIVAEGTAGGACYANGTCNNGVACGPDKKCVAGGIIEGALSFPGGGVPDGMEVCAERVDGWTTCSDQKIRDGKFKYGLGYRLTLPSGAYWILAKDPASPDAGAGWYTSAVPCGLQASCRNHLEILVDVAEGTTKTGVDPGDWYTTATEPVRERWAQVLAVREANGGRLIVGPATILELGAIMDLVEKGIAQPLTAADVVRLMGGRPRAEDEQQPAAGMSEERKRELVSTTWRHFDLSTTDSLGHTALSRALRTRREPLTFDWECAVFDVVVEKGSRDAGELRIQCSTTTTTDWSYSFKYTRIPGSTEELKKGDKLALSNIHMAIADPSHPKRLCFDGYQRGPVRFKKIG